MLFGLNTLAMVEYLPELWKGLLSTVTLSVLAFAGAMLLGIVACLLSIQSSRLLRAPAVAYVDLIRSTPLLAQLYFLYFGLPMLGIHISEFAVGVLALSINSGAYVGEIIRSGIIGIPRGQIEASASSGMSYRQQMQLVILPQALRPMVSPLIGQAIVLVKDSSLLSLISVFELTRAGQALAVDRFLPVEGLAMTTACYLTIYLALKFGASSWNRSHPQLARS